MTDLFNKTPDTLRQSIQDAWDKLEHRFREMNFRDLEQKHKFFLALEKAWGSSAFILEQCLRAPSMMISLVESGSLFDSIDSTSYAEKLNQKMTGITSVDELMTTLRSFRNQEMVRIAWRDISGWADLEETFCDLTHLAEACISETLNLLFQQARNSVGTPVNRQGKPQNLVILGMGKLGAWELNFSSDIDLIFAYEDDGFLQDKKSTSYAEFYTRLARTLVKTLEAVTEGGFVFRVDTRLRPFGESGPLVMNFDGMELYYQGQAREWERYAMVKARVVAGDLEAGERLQSILTAFVYRRYLDYRAFGELRELKRKITQELLRKDRLDNVKLGPGGIREIEFIGQAFQLIRGGQEKSLRERGILKVLDRVGELGYLPLDLVSRLKNAYRFLRYVENRIQQYADKQTHDLPRDEKQRVSLAFALDFPDLASFKARLDEVRAEVHGIFEQVIEAPQTAQESDRELDWIDADAGAMMSVLEAMGYVNASELLKLLADFQNSPSIRRITPKGAQELNRVFPLLLGAISKTDNAHETLGRILKLLESIAGRNVYFTLLAEYPQALSHLVKLGSASSWIVNHIARNPLLLDELLDPGSLYAPLDRDSLKTELTRALEGIDVDDIEQLMTVLRQFKQATVLKIAAADIMGVIPIMVVSDYLSWLAEVLVAAVLEHSWRLTAMRHGVPPGALAGETKGFGVIAYGKLGGQELSYSSDLDLVFLYGGVTDSTMTDGPSPIPCAQFYARVGKRMISLLTTQILSGTLYEIDLRLRPSGNSGLLVSSLYAYETYQMESAWTWEQQALVRARFVVGDAMIAEKFAAIRFRSLSRKRENEKLRAEVREMRDKMRETLETRKEGWFDLKQARGGIADIEFIVQFGVLSGAHDHESLLRWTDVVRLLESLRGTGFLDSERAEILTKAYCLFRAKAHRAALLELPALAQDAEFSSIRARVEAIWREIMEAH